MDDLEQHLNPRLARRIRDSASRAGLLAHDSAARMIAEMWVAVDALKQERNLLSSEVIGLTERVRQKHLYLLALTAIGTVNLALVIALLLT